MLGTLRYNAPVMNPTESDITQQRDALCSADTPETTWKPVAGEVLGQPDSIAELLGPLGEYDRFTFIKRVLSVSDRAQRNEFLTCLVNIADEGCKNDALGQINEVEIPQIERLLGARGFQDQAQEAAQFAMTQLAAETKEIKHVRAWLNKVAFRKALALKSKREKGPANATEGYEEIGGLSKHSDEQYVETVRNTSDMIGQCRKEVLSEQEDQVLEFHFFQERSAKEIAELMQMPLATVYHRLKQATTKLKSCVHQKGG